MKQNNVIESIEYKGYTINVLPDDFPYDPREDDNLGVMACWHRNCNLGDVQPKSNPVEYIAELLYNKGAISDDQMEYYENEDYITPELIKKFEKYFIWLPINAYEHSGITISTGNGYPYNDRWDSGQLGIIYVDKDDVRNEYKWDNLTTKRINQIEKYLKNEVDTYDDYLTGNVYGFEIIKLSDDDEEEEIDSCWGYYGDYDEYMIPECKANIDYWIEEHDNQVRIEKDYLLSNSPVFVGIYTN